MWVGIGFLGVVIFATIGYQGLKYDNGFVTTFAVIGAIISIIFGLCMDFKRKQELTESVDTSIDELLNNIEGFACSQKFYSDDRELVLAIDEDHKKICIIENQHNNMGIELSKTFSKFDYLTKIFDYDDILQTEVIEDDVTITKTSRSGQLGGALVGGLLAGGVGAIVGGLGASTTSSSLVKKLQLQIVVNNTQKTFYRIPFFSSKHALPKTNFQYKKALDNILHWYNILSYVIKVEDENEVKSK